MQAFPESPKIEYQGDSGLPSLRLNPHMYWGKGDWSMALTGYYISGHGDDDIGGDFSNTVGSHFEVGLQLSYNLPWNGSITVGANNLLNEGPETLLNSGGWEPFDWSLYDSRGRMVYFSYRQSL